LTAEFGLTFLWVWSCDWVLGQGSANRMSTLVFGLCSPKQKGSVERVWPNDSKSRDWKDEFATFLCTSQ
jgi:hypothetical protein